VVSGVGGGEVRRVDGDGAGRAVVAGAVAAAAAVGAAADGDGVPGVACRSIGSYSFAVAA